MSSYGYIFNKPFELTVSIHDGYVYWRMECNGHVHDGREHTEANAYKAALLSVVRAQYTPPHVTKRTKVNRRS